MYIKLYTSKRHFLKLIISSGRGGNGSIWWSNWTEPEILKYLYVKLNQTDLLIQTEPNRTTRLGFKFSFTIFKKICIYIFLIKNDSVWYGFAL